MRQAHDDRAVDIAFDEVDQDFLADSGDELAAPVGAGTAVRYAHPGGGFVVQVGGALGMVLRSLPVELQFDAAVFVGVDFFTCRADHGGGLHAGGGGLGDGVRGVAGCRGARR